MFSIRHAGIEDAGVIGKFVRDLVAELGAEVKHAQFYSDAALSFLTGDQNPVALIATLKGQPIGVITAIETNTIYGGGKSGIINELYIIPYERSGGSATHMLKHLKKVATEKGWLHLDVGAPGQPTWSRTLKFYFKNGFQEIGPRLRLRLK